MSGATGMNKDKNEHKRRSWNNKHKWVLKSTLSQQAQAPTSAQEARDQASDLINNSTSTIPPRRHSMPQPLLVRVKGKKNKHKRGSSLSKEQQHIAFLVALLDEEEQGMVSKKGYL